MYQQAVTADCEDIYELICQLEGERLPHSYFLSVFAKQLESPDYACLVYRQEGRISGVINLRFEGQLHHAEPVAEILEFITAPDCRGHGVGRALFEQACLLARERGCSLIEVACNQVRTDSHRFYEKMGMQSSHFKFSKTI